jgi:hypothetical protein
LFERLYFGLVAPNRYPGGRGVVLHIPLRSCSSESNPPGSWSRMLVDLRIKQGCCRKSWRSRCVIWPGCCTTLVKCWGLTPHLRLNGKASSGHLRKDRVTKVVLPRPFDRMLCSAVEPASCVRTPAIGRCGNRYILSKYWSGEVLTSRFDLATTSTTRN